MIGLMVAAALALAPGVPAGDPPHALRQAPVAVDEVMTLPAELRQRVALEVVAPTRSDTQRLQRLTDFMFRPEGLGMQYRHDATSTVEHAYLTRQANCLTFTLLFIALAREAGLDAYAQEIDQTLAWHQQDSTIYRTNHVNAGVKADARRYTVDVGSDSLIARDPPQRVSDRRLLSHFYNNRAADLMANQSLAQAGDHMRIALELDPLYANSWSNYGVLHLRLGDLDAARGAYDRALELDPHHAAALFNRLTLAERTGDTRGEADYRRRLDRARARDPFHQFLLAADHERHGRYAEAVEHYRRAIRLHGREHRFHFGLARVYLQLGQARLAGEALLRAQALGGDAWRGIYQAKLDRLARSGR
jgi:tetratricopeptide (TPR) repeat protein